MTDTRNEKYLSALRKMVQFDTVSVAGDVNPDKFRPFHALLRELFPALFSACDYEDFNGSFLLCWHGMTADKPILLMSHHDVVEAGGEWSHEPFAGDISDGKLWGRGTLDTKCSLCAILSAADDLIAEGYVPPHDVWIESACTEETDGSGARTIVAALKERGIKPDIVIDEGGLILDDPLGCAPHRFAVVGVGEKGVADLKFIADSNGGHASTPGKNTPLVRLGKFMAAVEKSDIFDIQLNDVTAELLRRSSKYMTGAAGFMFKNVNKFRGLVAGIMIKVSDTAAAMMRTTLAFTMARGSDGVNVLPHTAWVIGNMRFSAHQGQQASFDAVRRLAEKYDIRTEILDPGIQPILSDYRADEFKTVENAVSAVFGDVCTVPYVMTGASDCRYFTEICDNCYRFSPFFATDEQLKTIHGIDENINTDEIYKAVDFYKYIITGGEKHGEEA